MDNTKKAMPAKSNLKSMRTTSTTMTTKIKEQREPPPGAKIIDETCTVATEQIENGWLISKTFDGRYKEKGGDGDSSQYYYYTKRWYSKNDPLEIKITDASLADEFDSDKS